MLKNVLVCAIGGEKRAIELRWVREIATLGAITPMPAAPAMVAGVTSLKGAIVPVLHGARWLAAHAGTTLARPPRAVRAGDPVILIDVEGARLAMSVERIDAVTTLAAEGADLVDAAGARVPLLDPTALLATARHELAEAAAALPALLAGHR